VETEVGAEAVEVLEAAETLEVEEEEGAWIIEGATEEAEGGSEQTEKQGAEALWDQLEK